MNRKPKQTFRSAAWGGSLALVALLLAPSLASELRRKDIEGPILSDWEEAELYLPDLEDAFAGTKVKMKVVREHRVGINERVEFPVLATGVNVRHRANNCCRSHHCVQDK